MNDKGHDQQGVMSLVSCVAFQFSLTAMVLDKEYAA
jgi:hypothetical protein